MVAATGFKCSGPESGLSCFRREALALVRVAVRVPVQLVCWKCWLACFGFACFIKHHPNRAPTATKTVGPKAWGLEGVKGGPLRLFEPEGTFQFPCPVGRLFFEGTIFCWVARFQVNAKGNSTPTQGPFHQWERGVGEQDRWPPSCCFC